MSSSTDCMTCIEQALDAIAQAQELAGLLDEPPGTCYDLWTEAAHILQTAVRHATYAAGEAARVVNEHYRGLGWHRCGVCGDWKAPENLVEIPFTVGKRPTSRWYRCTSCPSTYDNADPQEEEALK